MIKYDIKNKNITYFAMEKKVLIYSQTNCRLVSLVGW